MTKQEPEMKSKTLPSWNLWLVNDDSIDLTHVVESIQEILKFSKQVSIDKALEAHGSGSTILLSAHQEKVEMFHEMFASKLPPVPTKIGPA